MLLLLLPLLPLLPLLLRSPGEADLSVDVDFDAVPRRAGGRRAARLSARPALLPRGDGLGAQVTIRLTITLSLTWPQP